MRNVVLLMVCFTSTVCGRRVQTLNKQMQSGLVDPLKALEGLLLARNLTAAYVPSGTGSMGSLRPVNKPSQLRAQGSAPSYTASVLDSVPASAVHSGGSAAQRSLNARSTAPRMVEFIPRSQAQVADAATAAVQQALADGVRRMEVTVPDGLCFYGNMGKQKNIGDPDMSVNFETMIKADRDLAYLVSEMFRSLNDEVACVLPAGTLDQAEIEWTQGRLPTKLVNNPEKLLPKTAKTGGGGGFGREGKAKKYRVIILTRPDKAMLKKALPVIKPLGDQVVVVLLNAKPLRSGKSRKGYTPTFILKDNPHPEWKGGLLYRAYPGKWLLGVAGNKGEETFVEGRLDERPSLEDLQKGLTEIMDDSSFMKKFESMLYSNRATQALERRVPDADEFEDDTETSETSAG